MPRFGGDLDIVQISADPTTPPAGRTKLYFKSDGLLYSKTPAGTVTQIGAIPSTLVTTNTTQTISGSKTFSSEIIGPATGNVLKVGDDARLVDVNIAHTLGVVSQTDAANKGGILFGTTAGNFRLEGSGAAGTATGTLNVTGNLTEAGARVYSPNNPPPASSGGGGRAFSMAMMGA